MRECILCGNVVSDETFRCPLDGGATIEALEPEFVERENILGLEVVSSSQIDKNCTTCLFCPRAEEGCPANPDVLSPGPEEVCSEYIPDTMKIDV